MSDPSHPIMGDTTKNILWHVENLLPGVLVMAAIPSERLPTALDSGVGKVESALVFICAAYVIGVVIFVASRMVFDRLCWRYIHPTVFYLFAKDEFRRSGTPCRWWDDFAKNTRQIKDIYDYVRSEAEHKSTFRTQQIDERRRRIRLVRSSIVPVALWAWILLPPIAAVVATLTMILLFAYGEVTIFEEALADRQDKPMDLDAIVVHQDGQQENEKDKCSATCN